MRTPLGRLALFSIALVVVAACGDDERVPVLDTNTLAPVSDDASSAPEAGSGSETAPTASLPTPDKPAVETPAEAPTELVITDLVEGSGEPAEAGDTVSVHYVGVLSKDGTEFDNSYDRGQPFDVTLGTGSVIAGWDQGLVGAKAGGRRQLDIPAFLGYGNTGSGAIGPCEALTFVVDIVAVTPGEAAITTEPPVTEDTVCGPLPPQASADDCPATDGTQEQVQSFSEYPPTCIDVTKTYTAEIVTSAGSLTVELFTDKAPFTVNNFVTLARYGYFDGTPCHRVIPSFVAQCGDPEGTGLGGPGYEFRDELPAAGEYQIGSLAMANSGPNTNGSQFFIVTGADGSSLPPNYSLFGIVTEGLDTTVPALDALGNPDPAANGVPPLEPVTIESVTITES